MFSHHSDQMSQRSQVSRVALCMSKVKVPFNSQWVSEWVSESVTRSPIELFWTAKKVVWDLFGQCWCRYNTRLSKPERWSSSGNQQPVKPLSKTSRPQKIRRVGVFRTCPYKMKVDWSCHVSFMGFTENKQNWSSLQSMSQSRIAAWQCFQYCAKKCKLKQLFIANIFPE